jgi:hypothetical protein
MVIDFNLPDARLSWQITLAAPFRKNDTRMRFTAST